MLALGVSIPGLALQTRRGFAAAFSAILAHDAPAGPLGNVQITGNATKRGLGASGWWFWAWGIRWNDSQRVGIVIRWALIQRIQQANRACVIALMWTPGLHNISAERIIIGAALEALTLTGGMLCSDRTEF